MIWFPAGIGEQNAAFTPSDISGLILHYTAKTGITDTAGEVSVWADQGPNGDDLAQATAADQPNTDTINGNEGVFFDGTGEFMANDALTATFDVNAMTVVFVITSDNIDAAPSDFFNFLRALNSQLIFAIRQANNDINGFWFLAPVPNVIIINNGIVADQSTWGIIRSRDDGVGTSDFIDDLGNSVAVSIDMALMNTDTGRIRIGDGTPAATEFSGHIHEIIVYDNFISDADRGLLETYLNTEWSVGP